MDNNSVSTEIERYLEYKLNLGESELKKELLRNLDFCTAEKGAHLLETGERPDQLYILWSGICRGFLVDENGQDTTDCFAVHRGDVLWGCGPLDEPSIIGMEALTDCELLQISMEELLRMMQKCDGMRMINRCLSQALEEHWTMRLMLCQNDAMKRYLWFLDRYPGLVDQVNKRHIASFLGMTPVSLSRLRKKLREREDAAAIS